MHLALQTAKKGLGFVQPNPPVGCVILDFEYNLLAVGYHKKYGADHAEVSALKKIKDKTKLKKARVFVTLEPCHHKGKTPSCAKTLARFPLHSLCYGAEDPFTKSRGLNYLREKNIKITKSLDFQPELENLIAPFKFSFLHKQAFVSLKVAVSLDGKMALTNGESQWITNQKAREHAHFLRAKHSAVLVGVNTVLKDNPRLDIRLKPYKGKQNKVIILDPEGKSLSFLPQSRLLKSHSANQVILCCATNHLKTEPALKGVENQQTKHPLRQVPPTSVLEPDSQAWKKVKIKYFKTPKRDTNLTRTRQTHIQETINKHPTTLQYEKQKATTIERTATRKYYFDLPLILKALYQEENIQSILVEGGSFALSEFLQQKSAQKLYLYMAPRIIGQGLSWSGDFAIPKLSQSLNLHSIEWDRIGEDLFLSGFFLNNHPSFRYGLIGVGFEQFSWRKKPLGSNR